MYDVVFIDAHGGEVRVAEHLADCAVAKDIARQAAAERGVGRMMLTGSQKPANCVCVVTTPDDLHPAAA